tara:strand:+ start:1178 stop:2788 length:1611 start_codon:yes stop_codon:yes gene_type:complete
MHEENSNIISNIPSNNDFFSKNSTRILIGILISGLIIRLVYFPFDTPFSLDVLDFFGYAVNASNFGEIPSEWFLANNGWPLLISIFFSIIPVESFFDFVNLQRMISISISVLTTIPIYLLCKNFFNKKIALIGSALFVFNPVIIKYSILAGNDVLYTMILTFTLYFMITNKIKIIYVSFFLIGILTVIRYEAFLLIIPFSILFIIKFQKHGLKLIPKILLAISCFIIIIVPFSMIDIINHGQDGLTSHLNSGLVHINNNIINNEKTGEDWTDNLEENILQSFILKGFENIFIHIIILLLPIMVFLIPYGIFVIFRKLDYKKLVLIMTGLTLLIPALYGYSRDFNDTKFLIPLIPIFTILSLFLIEKIYEKIYRKNTITLIILVGIVSSSILIVELNQIDYAHEKEKFFVAEKVVRLSDGYTYYHPESIHIKGAEVKINWLEKIPNDSNGHVERQIKAFDYEMDDTLDEILRKYETEGLTHIIIDQNQNRPSFFVDVFHNEEKYPFLMKEYDSEDNNLIYKVKIFRIDYDIFNILKN